MYKNIIGFTAKPKDSTSDDVRTDTNENTNARQSVVRIFFPDRHMTLSYYNDQFDLHKGDIVYVDGKLEGLRGYVVEVNYSFKIKLSDYKKVIGVADTKLKGKLYLAGSHIAAFDRDVIPFEKVVGWFKAPDQSDDYVIGKDPFSFPLDDLSCMTAKMNDPAKVDKGYEYYSDDRVCYLCLDGNNGKAIVSGTKTYIVEFNYHDGDISNLVCSCYCSGYCKHTFAAMLQLKNTLELILNEYEKEYDDYFAAISKDKFIGIMLLGKNTGKLEVDIF